MVSGLVLDKNKKEGGLVTMKKLPWVGKFTTVLEMIDVPKGKIEKAIELNSKTYKELLNQRAKENYVIKK